MEGKLKTAGNENTYFIKVIAIICMIIDHTGCVFFPYEPAFRVIGRLAFPLYAWCLVVGSEYSRNHKKYVLRLFLAGLLSQPLFMAVLNHSWYELNIFFTLLLGLLGIVCIRQRKNGSHIWGPLIMLLVSCAVYVDYFWQGVLLIFLLYAARKSRPALAAVMIAFCLYWGSSGASMAHFFGLPLPIHSTIFPQASSFFMLIRRIQFWAILALPLMIFPVLLSVRLPKWLSYAAYPAHLLIIFLIRLM